MHLIFSVCCCFVPFCSFLSSISVIMVTEFRTFPYKSCLRKCLKGECPWTLTIKNRRIIGSATGSREKMERYDRLRIPPRKLGWSKGNKFFDRRKKGSHGWHAHPRRKQLTARRKPQAREINRQYREFGKKKSVKKRGERMQHPNIEGCCLKSAQTSSQNGE